MLLFLGAGGVGGSTWSTYPTWIVVADGITLRLRHPPGSERWFDFVPVDTQTEVMAVTGSREEQHLAILDWRSARDGDDAP